MGNGRRGLFILLVVGILLPSTILAVFGFRSLRQDRVLAERQTRDALQSALELAAREVSRELARWQEWDDPSAAVIVLDPAGTIHSARGLLWLPGDVREPALPPEAEWAEAVEIQQKDYAKALRLYETALRRAPPRTRGALLLRIARTAHKAGDPAKALRSWRDILSLPPSSATAAAMLELVTSGDVPAIALYRDLISGHFPLSRESYFFYSGRVKELAGDAAVSPLADRERRRVVLAEAAEAFLAVPKRNPAPGFAAFWTDRKVVLIGEDALHARLTRAAQAGAIASITLRPRHAGPLGFSVMRPLDDAQLPWQIEAAPRDPAALERSLRNRQRLFVGSLAVVFAALVCGLCLTAHALSREWKLARLQSDFVATVSHEFRSPLTGIRQLAELLDSEIVRADDRRRDYYRLILQESGRLTRLIENLLDFSRLEAGNKQYRMETIDSSRWLEETAAMAHNPRLRGDIPPGLPAVRGDRDALASAVVNLMDNAFKYSPLDSPVRLSAQSGRDQLSISVTDHGPGIAPEEQARIFDRFYRGGGDLSAKVKGAGIGLSLVKRIVEDHGGKISVVSRPGQGSTFTIDLKTAGSQPQ